MLTRRAIARVLVLIAAAIGVQSVHASELEYYQCIKVLGSNIQVTKFVLDEANATVSRNYEAPMPAAFADANVSWGGNGDGLPHDLDREDLTLTIDFFGNPVNEQCKQIPPYDNGERQKWTIRALSLNCYESGSGEGNSPTIELKGQMRLDVNFPRSKSRIVFNVTSKKGYRRIFCDGRNHTATDPARFVLEGNPDEMARARWRVRTNFDELDFGSPFRGLREYKQGGLAQAHWPDKIAQGSSPWMKLPRQGTLDAGTRVVREFDVPERRGQPNLKLRVEFHRVE
jgi:hypothetical protein